MSTFWVESTNDKMDGKVLLWEKHPSHPNGECFIANDGNVVEVDETPAVKKLFAEGLIKRVNWNSKPIPVQPFSKPQTVLATDESEDEVIARVEVKQPAPESSIQRGGINRGGRPPKRGQ